MSNSMGGLFQSKSVNGKGKTSRRRAIASLVGAIALVDCTTHLHGATVTATYGGGTGNWSTPTNWSTNPTVPNNGANGVSDYDVLIPTSSSVVTLDTNVTIDSVSLVSGALLNLLGGETMTLTASAAISNSGTITIDSNNSSTSTLTVTNGTLSGTGSIVLNSVSTDAVLAGTITGSTNTISGYGTITATVTNSGTIDADVNGQALSLTGNVANNNLLEATGGGTLNVGAITVNQGSGGQISAAAGSVVTLAGTSISNGTLVSSGTGVIETISATTLTLSGVTNNSTLDIIGNSDANITGNLVDNGLITVNSNDSSTSTIDFSGGTLSGTGTVVLNSGTTNATMAGTLTQASGHTISGYGEISGVLTNKGLVNANVANQTLYFTGTGLTNTSTIEATTGVLNFGNGVSVTNTGGLISAGTSTVILTGSTITGGTISTAAGGLILAPAATGNTLTNVTSNSTFDMVGGSSVTVTGTFVNNGTITVNSNDSSSSTLSFSSGTLTGTGSIVLGSNTSDAVLSGTITGASTNTISGFGEVTANLVNNATVDADVSGQSLTLLTSNMTNNSVMEATGGGTLGVSGITLTQGVGGSITASNGTVDLVNAIISGGPVFTSGASSTVELSGSSITGSLTIATGGVGLTFGSGTSTVASVTNNSTFDVVGQSNLTITGNLLNNGTVTVNSNNSATSTLSFTSGTITGTGTIVLNSNTTDAVLAGAISQSSTSTISGFGEITATVTNNGTIDANGNILALTANVTNSNLMEATVGGQLDVGALTVTQASGGLLSAAGGTIDLAGTTVSGGTLSSSAGGLILANSATTVTLASVTNNSTLDIVGGSSANITGNLVDNGLITVNSNDSSTSTIDFSGGTLSGTGTIVLNSNTTDAVLAGTITQSSTHTISGYGEITATVANNGLINANVAGQTLTIAAPVSGTGTLAAGAGATLAFATGVGGSTVGALSISPTGQLNLANNHLFIHYGTGPDPIASIAALLASGYAGGNWSGLGINSTAAEANRNSYGLGYADSADTGNPANLSAGTIEIKYTLLGDANLDGVVNGIDFGILAANFNKGVTGWDQGDFNYDNVVNGVDFADLAANFNKGATGIAVGPPAIDDPAIVAFAEANGLMADVPEPACAGLMVVAAAGVLAQRRKRTF